MQRVFSIEDRERVRDRVLAMAAADGRVVAGAALGSLARDEGDRWSDLDLMFAVAEGVALTDVLDDWSRTIVREHGAVRLFDLTSGAAVYRVFLLPGCLQLDLSFAPARAFGASGPRFRLLIGEAVERARTPPPQPYELFGYAVHHAVRARVCIERGRSWQAEYWISGVRDYALSLACRARGLQTSYGRGFDHLPAEVLDGFGEALVRSLERDELRRALAAAVAGLRSESGEVRELATSLEGELRDPDRVLVVARCRATSRGSRLRRGSRSSRGRVACSGSRTPRPLPASASP